MRKTIVLMLVIAICSGAAFADDIFAPEWRGQQRTTQAVWDTWQNGVWTEDYIDADTFEAVPASGLVFEEPASAGVYGQSGYVANLAPWEGVGERFDLIEVNGEMELDLWIPNFDENPMKEINLQITYSSWEDISPVLWVDAFMGDNQDAEFDYAFQKLASHTHDDGWVTDAYTIVVEPNPTDELITLSFDSSAGWEPYPMYVDQVVVDTACVPEPASLSVLGLGVAFFLRRRTG